MILFLLFCFSYGERNFRKRAFHKQLLREDNEIVKTSLKTTISVRKLFGKFCEKLWHFNQRHSCVFIYGLMHASKYETYIILQVIFTVKHIYSILTHETFLF